MVEFPDLLGKYRKNVQIAGLRRDCAFTCARALLRIRGPQSASLLSKLCAIDFADTTTPDGSALRASVAELVTDIVREDDAGFPAYWLHCEWSSGQYLFDALLNAGQEFEIEVDGFSGS